MVKRKYNWNAWFARKRFTLRQGVEFNCGVEMMEQQVRNAASAREIKVSIVTEDDRLTVVVQEPVLA